jgi:hypothetical protein
MSTVPYPPQRPLSVGEVLDLSFRIYRATLVKCLLFATCGVIAGQLWNIYTLTKGRPLAGSPTGLEGLLAQARDPTLDALYVIGVVLSAIFYAAVLLRQRALMAEGASANELSAALRRTPALIALFVLICLGSAACFLPAWVAGGGLRVLLILVGAIALSCVLVAISCAPTILLLDDVGPVVSLSRSWQLTSGSFWRLSIIYTVALFIILALSGVIAAVAAFMAGALAHGDVVMFAAFAEVIAVLLGTLSTPFYCAVALAVLADLKVRKEGADLAQRISATA